MAPTIAQELRSLLDAAELDATQARQAFDDARAKAIAEHGPEKIVTDQEIFGQLDGLNRVYCEKAEVAEQRRDQVKAALTWDPDGQAADGQAAKTGADSPDIETGILLPGERFVKSSEYGALLTSGVLDLERAPVNLPPVKAMTRQELLDMLEGKAVVTGLSDTSAGAFIRNMRLPGFLDLLQRQPRVANLVTVSGTDSDVVEWVRETSFTNAAAEVLEATTVADGLKPESSIALDVVSTIVQQIAHYINVTRRALADAAQIRTLLDTELRRGIELRLDSQMINGNGTTPNLRGILNTAGIGSQARGTDSRADAVRKAITVIRLAFLEPNAVLIHPTDGQTLALEKDANGTYYSGSPYNQDPALGRLWGLQVVESPVIAAGTALVGDWSQAYLWVREGVSVLTSENVADYFLRNIITLLAEARFAFGVPRPAAFCQVTGM